MAPKIAYFDPRDVQLTDPVISNPIQWREIMIRNEFSDSDSNTIKAIIDWIMDNIEGSFGGKLRKEMEMQKGVYLDKALAYDEYELFVWSSEEGFPGHEFDDLLKEAVAEMRKPDRTVSLVSQAVNTLIIKSGPFSNLSDPNSRTILSFNPPLGVGRPA